MKQSSMQGRACLDCGVVVDMNANAEDRIPTPGDMSVCMYCGHLMAFADDLSFRPLTDAEIVSAAGDPEILFCQKVRQMVLEKKAQGTKNLNEMSDD